MPGPTCSPRWAWPGCVNSTSTPKALLDSDLRLLEHVEAEIANLEKLLIPRAYGDPRVKLLMTLPGVDYTVAQTVLGAFGDIARFKDGDHAAAYLGLVPSTKQSAERCYHGPITKQGNGHARWLLVQAAQHVAKHPGPLGVFFRRLAKRKNRNVAVVAVARKLVVIAWHLLTKNEPYRYAQPLSTEGKLQRLRVKATGEKRKTGPSKGSKAGPKLAAGTRSRTVKPLAQVCVEEGLPTPGTPPAGEARTLTQTATTDYVNSLNEPQVRAQRRGSTGSGESASGESASGESSEGGAPPGILPQSTASCGGIF
jgi:transposase